MRRVECKQSTKGDLWGDFLWGRGNNGRGALPWVCNTRDQAALDTHISSYSFTTLAWLRKGKGVAWVHLFTFLTPKTPKSTPQGHSSLNYSHFNSSEDWIASKTEITRISNESWRKCQDVDATAVIFTNSDLLREICTCCVSEMGTQVCDLDSSHT